MDRFEKAGAAFADLCRVMAHLRAPGGCPWDREQTLDSLKPYLLEETYETLDAIDKGDPKDHCEELGDLLLQVVFQAEIAQETSFDIADVSDGIREKLIRRHPHVFEGADAKTAKDVVATWEAIKAAERPKSKGLLDGVPKALPALLRAYRTGEKASGVGFDWPDAEGPKAKVLEEWEEIQAALTIDHNTKAISGEIGDMLFALVNYSRHLGIDPESALRETIDRFHLRFRHIERALQERGSEIRDTPIDSLNDLWEEAKSKESDTSPMESS